MDYQSSVSKHHGCVFCSSICLFKKQEKPRLFASFLALSSHLFPGSQLGQVSCPKARSTILGLVYIIYFWVVVSNIFYFYPYLGKWWKLTNIFQMGWNHQLDLYCDVSVSTMVNHKSGNMLYFFQPSTVKNIVDVRMSGFNGCISAFLLKKKVPTPTLFRKTKDQTVPTNATGWVPVNRRSGHLAISLPQKVLLATPTVLVVKVVGVL